MTDNEIIKALELCNRGICKGCSFYDVECCIAECRKEALDLINRQKAELERLKSMNQSKLDIIHDVRADLETAKVEAIKEFAERLKAVSHPYADTQMVFELQIDNLVKEMTEERK